MMKDPKIFVGHILESINFIEKYTDQLDFEDFANNQQVQDSVLRRFEIIGEAVKNLPLDFKNTSSKIPWKQMAGMRDVLIHDYFGIDVLQVWNTVKSDLPKIKVEMERL